MLFITFLSYSLTSKEHWTCWSVKLIRWTTPRLSGILHLQEHRKCLETLLPQIFHKLFSQNSTKLSYFLSKSMHSRHFSKLHKTLSTFIIGNTRRTDLLKLNFKAYHYRTVRSDDVWSPGKACDQLKKDFHC